MRSKIVAGNWKMNKNKDEAAQLTSEIANMVNDEVKGDAKVVLIPPAIHIPAVAGLLKGSRKVELGAQNIYFEENGAYTGEISAGMVKSYGASYVVIGHSERREYFNEEAELLNKKTATALKHGLTPIFCCGESLSVRENGLYKEFVENQIHDALFHFNEEDFKKIVIAYEPVWAIGTGKTASSEQAQEMHAHIRNFILNRYGTDTASSVSILYGGSVKPDNAQELFACDDVDGGLIGGASLKSRDFTDIIKSI